jgi:TolB-like protein
VVGYLPPKYAATSPVVIYNDEYLNAAYNPMPFLAVLTPKSLKPDEKTDWIGTATADSLVVRLSSTPGLFVAERDQVTGVLRDQKLLVSDVAEPGQAAQVGKALDVERVIAGSYVVDGEKVLVNLRIVDVQTGTVQGGVSKTIPREHMLDAMPELASSLTTALGFQPQDEPPASSITIPPVAKAVNPTGRDAPTGMPTPGARWLNTSYGNTLVHVEGDQWIQVDNNTKKVDCHYTEVARNREYIELKRNEGGNFRPELQTDLRVYAHRVDFKKDGKWKWVSNGHWEK